MSKQIMWNTNKNKRKAIKLKQRIALANNAVAAGVRPSVAAGWYTLSTKSFSPLFGMFIYA